MNFERDSGAPDSLVEGILDELPLLTFYFVDLRGYKQMWLEDLPR